MFLNVGFNVSSDYVWILIRLDLQLAMGLGEMSIIPGENYSVVDFRLVINASWRSERNLLLEVVCPWRLNPPSFFLQNL